MAWDLSGVRRGTSDGQGCDGLKVQTYGKPIGITASHAFLSRLRPFLGWRRTENERLIMHRGIRDCIQYNHLFLCQVQHPLQSGRVVVSSACSGITPALSARCSMWPEVPRRVLRPAAPVVAAAVPNSSAQPVVLR